MYSIICKESKTILGKASIIYKFWSWIFQASTCRCFNAKTSILVSLLWIWIISGESSMTIKNWDKTFRRKSENDLMLFCIVVYLVWVEIVYTLISSFLGTWYFYSYFSSMINNKITIMMPTKIKFKLKDDSVIVGERLRRVTSHVCISSHKSRKYKLNSLIIIERIKLEKTIIYSWSCCFIIQKENSRKTHDNVKRKTEESEWNCKDRINLSFVIMNFFLPFYRTMNMSHRRLNSTLCTTMMIWLFLFQQFHWELHRESELLSDFFSPLVEWWICAIKTSLMRISMLGNFV